MTTPKTLSEQQSHDFIVAISKPGQSPTKRRNATRNTAIALLMLDAGLRVSEVVWLLITDLWFKNLPVKSIFLDPSQTKNKEPRTIPCSKRLCDAINEMHRVVWPDVLEHNGHWAFNGAKYQNHITTRQVERIVRNTSKLALGFEIHPHILRHTFASRLMRKTNIRVVQQLLGHKSLSSTQIYTHPNSDDLINAIVSIQ